MKGNGGLALHDTRLRHTSGRGGAKSDGTHLGVAGPNLTMRHCATGGPARADGATPLRFASMREWSLLANRSVHSVYVVAWIC